MLVLQKLLQKPSFQSKPFLKFFSLNPSKIPYLSISPSFQSKKSINIRKYQNKKLRSLRLFLTPQQLPFTRWRFVTADESLSKRKEKSNFPIFSSQAGLPESRKGDKRVGVPCSFILISFSSFTQSPRAKPILVAHSGFVQQQTRNGSAGREQSGQL